MPALIPVVADPDEQFQHARALAMPWYADACIDYDIRFAAVQTVKHLADLREFRRAAGRAITALAHRCESLSAALKVWQPESVSRVASGVHVGFLAVMAAVVKWPDTRVAQRFITGFRVVWGARGDKCVPAM